jgi:hypothetical protein
MMRFVLTLATILVGGILAAPLFEPMAKQAPECWTRHALDGSIVSSAEPCRLPPFGKPRRLVLNQRKLTAEQAAAYKRDSK